MTPDQDIIALAETCMGVPQTVPALDQHEDYVAFVALPEEVIAFAREIRNAALEEADAALRDCWHELAKGTVSPSITGDRFMMGAEKTAAKNLNAIRTLKEKP